MAAEVIVLKGRGVIPGVVEAQAMVCPEGLSAYGGLNVSDGCITDFESVNHGQSIKGRILILPCSKGSNGWSSSFTALKVAGSAPAAWAFSRVDSSVGVAVTTVDIPTVVDFSSEDDPCRRIKSGDLVRLDGHLGTLTIISSKAD